MKTYYELIGVAPSATPDEIKHAFRREIARYHPDKVQHLGQEFQEIAAVRAAELTEAYRVLMDPAARETYDGEIKSSGQRSFNVAPGQAAAGVAREPAVRQESPSEFHRDREPVDVRTAESFTATRATLTEFVKRATLKRFAAAASAICDAMPVEVPGFDAAYDCAAKRGYFKKGEPPLRLLARVVTAVDAVAIQELWPLALKAGAAKATVCIMLMGQGVAPANELAASIAEQRRKSRNAGPTLIPLDFRDWDALFPPDTPALARAVVERLRQGDS